jgi:hypothetical protein
MSAEPTGHKRGVRNALTLTLAAALALPAAAQADSFRGKTSQRRMASVLVGDDGFVSRIRISYSAPCTDPRYRYPNVLRIEPPFDEATTEAVTEELVLRDKLEGGGRSRQTATITATREVDAAGDVTWGGTFKTRAVLTKNGRRFDVCELKRVTWTAKLVSEEDQRIASPSSARAITSR